MTTLQVDGLTVLVERKPIKNSYLRIKPPEGQLHVTCPTGTTDGEIVRMVRQRWDWILTHQASVQAKAQTAHPAYQDGDTIPVWGERWRLEVQEVPGRYACIHEDRARRVLLLKIGSPTSERRRAALDAWYRRELKEAVPSVLARCEARSGLHAETWTVKQMSSRWGSCKPSERKITLNVQLAKYPPECLEMVVYHELCHLLEANHGPRFYAHLARFCPDWRRADAILKGKAGV